MPLSLLRCIAEFTLGMGCYRLAQHAPAARRLAPDRVAVGLILACGGLMLLRLDLPTALLFPALIVALAANRGAVARLMSTRALHGLGVISFSLYLTHQLFRPIDLALLQAWHPAPLGEAAALLFALAGSGAVVPFAWLTYVLVERPSRTLIRSLLGAKPAAEATA